MIISNKSAISPYLKISAKNQTTEINLSVIMHDQYCKMFQEAINIRNTLKIRTLVEHVKRGLILEGRH